MARVLVTGGTGFVAAHCLVQLLAAGHETRATVRDLKRESDVRAMLRQGGAGDVGERLTLSRADLNADAGWAEAAAGCDYVLHVASPFPSTVPKDENELIVAGPGRGAARAQGRARRWRQARGHDLVLRGYRVWRPEGSDRSVHGRGLDEPQRSERAALSEIEDDRRARRLGFHRSRRRDARTGRGQSGPRPWASPWTGHLALDPLHQPAFGRLSAGLPRSLVRRRRCAGRSRSALEGDDRPCRARRAVSRHRGRFRERPRDRRDAQGWSGRRRPQGSDPRACPVGSCAWSGCSTLRSKEFCPSLANARTRPMKRRVACSAGRREARGTRFWPRRGACRSLGSLKAA